MTRLSDRSYRDLLAILFAIIWALLAIAPLDRHDWALENLLVLAAALAFLWWRKALPLSKLSSTLIFVFLCVHEVGAHYTYSEVPYDSWAQMLFGVTINEIFGFTRNHFDRLEHFFYGALLAYPMREAYVRAQMLTGRMTYTIPVAITLAFSAMYEIFEWWAAEIAGGRVATSQDSPSLSAGRCLSTLPRAWALADRFPSAANCSYDAAKEFRIARSRRWEGTMLTFDDCVALCELTAEEIEAIAEHEHLPMIVAAELGNYLIQAPDGALRVKRIILDDMLAANRAGDSGHALTLKLVLRHFVERHPECQDQPAAPPEIVSESVRQFLEAGPAAS